MCFQSVVEKKIRPENPKICMTKMEQNERKQQNETKKSVLKIEYFDFD